MLIKVNFDLDLGRNSKIGRRLCTQPGFVAYSCRFSRRYVKLIVLCAANKVNPQFATLTLKLGQGKKILFSNGSPGQNIWVHNFVPRSAENSVSEVDPRLEKQNGNADLRCFVLTTLYLHQICATKCTLILVTSSSIRH